MSTLKKLYKNEIRKQLQDKNKYDNVMQVPVLEKIVINRGIGEATTNSKAVEMTQQVLAAITGQKPVVTRAKVSISNFKLREGQAIGCKVTLRSDKMYDFLTKFLKLALPRIRDFKGVSAGGFDGRGNYTLGIREDIIFPETKQDNLDKVRGFDITFVTNTNNDEDAFDLLKSLGMPFRNELKKRVNK